MVRRPAAQARSGRRRARHARSGCDRPRQGRGQGEERRRRRQRRRGAQRGRGQRAGGSSTATKPCGPTRQAGHGRRRSTPRQAREASAPTLADDAAPGDPSRPLLASVDAGKVVVLLFWNKHASDDRATRQGLRSIDLHDGKVVASAVAIDDVGRYEAITRGVQVLESPTVLVIGAGGKAREITGYAQAKEIDQAVSDIGGTGFEAQEGLPASTASAKVADDACKDFELRPGPEARPADHGPPALSKALGVAAPRSMPRARPPGQGQGATTADERKLKATLVAFAGKDSKWIADARAAEGRRPARRRVPRPLPARA